MKTTEPATQSLLPIGILGGVFDPIHFGHLATAKFTLEFFGLRKILFIPAGIPPHKTGPRASAIHRLAMLSIAVKDHGGFEVWDGELRRRGASYTVDTLRQLSTIYPGAPLHFIIGSDNIREIPLWHDFKNILRLTTFCITHRPGHALTIPPALKAMKYRVFPGPEWNISSTMMRRYLSVGLSCDFLMPPGVLDYIKKNRLYR